MWDKVVNFSRILFLPASITYLTGFICLTAYYAQFGIITFDIINARFLIAGFIVLLPLTLCAFAAFQLYLIQYELSKNGNFIVSWKATRQRYKFYFYLWLYPAAIATACRTVYLLGDIAKAVDPANYKFAPIFRWDIISYFINWAMSSAPPTVRAYVGILLYALPITVLIVVALIGAAHVFGSEQPAAPSSAISSVPKEESIGQRRMLSILLGDILACSLLGALAYYSFYKLEAQMVSIENISNIKSNIDYLGDWTFLTVLVFTFVAFSVTPITSNELTLFKSVNPASIQQTFQFLVFPTLASIYLFGAVIFPSIPFVIGGGMPRLVQIEYKKDSLRPMEPSAYLLGESTQLFFVVSSEKPASAYQISKDLVGLIRSGQAAQSAKPSPTKVLTPSSP